MSSELAVKVTGLGKQYQIYDAPRLRLLQMLFRGKRKYFREFWALNDVSFEVRRGETVGIVGRNGAGKSTLLQIICGTLSQTTGHVEVNGRVGALLELGSGFNPEYTGRENVFLNGALLGFSRAEIEARFDQIVDFSGIGNFIDQPVKTYSSGMVVRLAFAVQAQSEPDLLIVDEALAVGDAKFQAKCFARLKKLKENGTSILLVTHATEQIVTHCDRAVFLNDGRVVANGLPRDVINAYMDFTFGVGHADKEREAIVDKCKEPSVVEANLSFTEDRFGSRKSYNGDEYRWGDGTARILDFELSSDGVPDQLVVRQGAKVHCAFSIRFFGEVIRPIVGFTIKNKEGVTLYNTNSELQGIAGLNSAGCAGSVAKAEVLFNCSFSAGDYFISVGVASRRPDGTVVPHDRRYDSIQMTVAAEGPEMFSGFFDIGAKISVDVVANEVEREN